MARIPEPNNIKALKGERHKDRYLPDGIQVDTLTEIPKPPTWWPSGAAELYQHKGKKLLLAHQMLTEMDLSYIQQLCLIENKLNEIWQSGEVPPGALISQFNSYCAFAGLSLVSRQKIKVTTAIKKS